MAFPPERDLTHAFDRGYWARYDGRMEIPTDREEAAGWRACDAEMAFEKSERRNRGLYEPHR